MKLVVLLVAFTCLLHLPTFINSNIIRSLIRNNVAGPPVNFETVPWPFDPDAGLRRRADYEARNGRFGYKHVERIGLGEDGREEERRVQQRIRDSVGGLSYQVPE